MQSANNIPCVPLGAYAKREKRIESKSENPFADLNLNFALKSIWNWKSTGLAHLD